MTFDAIYAANAWNGTESMSGPGSSIGPTRRAAWALEFLVRGLPARTVLNLACGDDLWTPDLPAAYLGVDVAEAAIEAARRHHPTRAYEVADGRSINLGEFGLVVCRDAIQHLSFQSGTALVEAARRHGRWMLLSTYTGTRNRNIADGGYYEPDLTVAPFSLPAPWLMVPDGWDYADGTTIRDRRKWLALWPGGLP